MKKFIQVFFMVLLVLTPLLAYAQGQKVTITGTVTDNSGEPLPGVSVFVKDTQIGTVTDVNGKYSLTLTNDDVILDFSFIGFLTKEVSAKGQKEINVKLEEDFVGLEETVVVGYSKQKKQTVSGSVGTVTSKELIQRPAANTSELLQGLVPGLVTRQSSGLPGADNTTLNIRGFGSPLVMIDGIQGSIDQIDPNDIESVSVLKDASAAIYGARAGNGVILVTTKRGSNKKSKINYNGAFSFTQPTFLPDRVGAHRWAEMLHESGLDPNNYSPHYVEYDPDQNTLTNILDGSEYKGYDWSEALYKDWVFQQQHNLNASGGTDKIRYFVSAGYTDQQSNFKSGDYDYNRYNIRSNIDAKITKDFSISVDFSYRKGILDKANFSASDMYNSLQTAKPVYPVINEADPTRATYSGFLQRSPYYQTFKDYSGFIKDEKASLQGAIQLKYDLPWVKGLSLKAKLSYEETFRWLKNVSKPFDVWEWDPTESTPDGEWILQGTQGTNKMFVYSSKGTELLPLFSIEYGRSFGSHNLRALLISETQTYDGTSLRGDRKNILSYESPYLRYASEEGKDNYEGTSQSARTSVIGRINYDYKRKYILDFTLRADASAEYSPNSRWGYFPSISAAWRISNESFIQDNSNAIDNLKLRLSFGMLGNDAVSSFDYLSGYNISTNFYIFGATPYPVIYSAGLANPDITWESMKIYNVGLDASFWRGLFGFEIDAFYRLRENILAQPTEQVPATFGASLPRTNLNKRDNRGVDVLLRHRNRIGQFVYHVNPMISWARGKYVDIQEEVSDDPEWNCRYVREGQWDDRQWGYLTDGFFMTQEEINNHPVDQDLTGNTTLKVGDLKYKDVNEDGVIDWRDQRVIGASGLPNLMYSIDMGLEFKGIQLSMLWQGAGMYMVNFSGSAAAPFSNESIPLELHYKYRAIVETGPDGDYIANPDEFELPPVTQNGRTNNNSKASDFWSYDTHYLRLKNLNLSYSLPRRVISGAGINDCVFYLSATNLLTIDNLGIWKHDFDPEVVGQNGRDYPPLKTVTLGIRFTF
jgi:TonB-linked SusC/RagA family outer membrane protein